MIEIDYEKFTIGEIINCERSALYRTMGHLEAILTYPDSYTKEEIELAKIILLTIKECLALVLKS